jgi:hypothetical protein
MYFCINRENAEEIRERKDERDIYNDRYSVTWFQTGRFFKTVPCINEVPTDGKNKFCILGYHMLHLEVGSRLAGIR